MNWIDVLLILIAILSTLNGIKSGLMAGLVEFANLLISLFLAVSALPVSGALFRALGLSGGLAMFFGYFAVFIIMQIVLVLAERPFVKRMKRTIHGSSFNPLDRTFGPVPQILMFLIGTSFVLAVLVTFPLSNPLKTAVLNSRLGKPLAAPAVRVLNTVAGKT